MAVDDSFAPVVQSGVNYYLNLVQNNFDNSGNAFRIYEVINLNYNSNFNSFSDTSLSFYSAFTNEMWFKYRLCQLPDTTVLSNWAHVYFNPTKDINNPIARADSVVIGPGDTVYVNVLANDYDLHGDSIYIIDNFSMYSVGGELNGAELIGDSVKIVLSFNYFDALNNGEFILPYRISNSPIPSSSSTYDQGMIYIKVENNQYYDYLDINNIKARFSCFGNHFWDLGGNPEFFYPNGSTKTASFANQIWIGGKSYGADTVLHLAADRFVSEGGEFAWGPISDSYDLAYSQKWFRTWKLSKTEIEYHKQNWWQAGYSPIENILTWPGNGDVSLGQAQVLGSFHDNNNNGIYEPMQGDYPYIRGDQAIFFIFNDDRMEHYETGGIKFGIEVQGMAYAFDSPQNPALWNTVFLHYDIINRSDTDYNEMYLGNWTDADLGYSYDDYVGCNVEEGYFYFFNGNLSDGNGQINAYGQNPPFSAIKILGGPLMDPDNLDNPDGGCDESVNGTFFGDTIIDNERLGMTGFRFFTAQLMVR